MRTLLRNAAKFITILVGSSVFLAFLPRIARAQGEGSMIKTASNPAVYLIRGGQRHLVPDSPTVESLGGWGLVRIVSQHEVDAIPLGTAILSVTHPWSNEGSMIKSATKPEVYLVQGSQKHHVLDRRTVNVYGCSGVVQVLGEREVEAIPLGADIPSVAQPRSKEGLLIKSDKPEVYLVSGGQKHHVPDSATVDSCGGWGSVQKLSQKDVDSIPTGVAIATITPVCGTSKPWGVFIMDTVTVCCPSGQHPVFTYPQWNCGFLCNRAEGSCERGTVEGDQPPPSGFPPPGRWSVITYTANNACGPRLGKIQVKTPAGQHLEIVDACAGPNKIVDDVAFLCRGLHLTCPRKPIFPQVTIAVPFGTYVEGGGGLTGVTVQEVKK